MIIIPIGIDCGLADLCRKYNLRNEAFPFDWNVSYNGVSECIENDFTNFTGALINKTNIYNIFFFHDFVNNNLLEFDKQKYNRRCERFINILKNSTEEVIFCRKGHACHNHLESNNICNDINEVKKLNTIISNKYPHLQYKIIVILVCDKCFNPHEMYKTESSNIEIYNIATPNYDNKKFENLFCSIFKQEFK